MKERLTVCRDGDPIYDICMETSFEGLKEELAAFHLEKRKICIVTDSNVASGQGKRNPKPMLQHGFCFYFSSR